MKIPVPKRILYLLVCLSLFDLSAEILAQTFPILADTIRAMNNLTLINHYGIIPTDTSISVLNSLITSSETVGTLLSLLFVIPLAETKGRKYLVIYIRSALTMLTAVCQISSAFFQATEFYILSQFFYGLQHPLRSFLTFMYVTECAPDKNRGFACTTLLILNGIVKMIMLPIASPSVFGKSDTWFVFPLTALISNLLILVPVSKLPESPKWLVCQNRMTEAKESVEYYHGKDCFSSGVLMSLLKEKNLTVESHVTLNQVWENDTLREGFKVLFAFLFFFLLDSANVQSMYSVQLHQSVGFTVQEALNINLILSIVFFPAQFLSTVLLDWIGRRPVFFISAVLMYFASWIVLITQLIVFFVGPSLLTKIMYVSMECIGQISSNTGVAILRILFITELFPPSARTSVSQAMLFATLAMNSSLMSSFPVLFSFFPPGFFMPFVVTQLIFGVYMYKHMPETKGRTVCDIIESMDENVMSRTATLVEEKIPLIKSRAWTLAAKRNSILNISRSRTLTYDQKYIPKNQIY
ncbi:hypothetical protein GCK72_024073 [Caenorhabditis remanei]|uniref:Major facilitator superfamily (MFS) profile domain-containing protein n=1 Tax=Caenorhabditis remanei TaxID=31234 RepID=A0A6A5FY60_CAERE|nr:hypothetical protein GCK72_024073 [Caenorhabditis remanei]KAF1747608.1 hypothetical protein GCK72_024073 [Caenorhabditis remanei]